VAFAVVERAECFRLRCLHCDCEWEFELPSADHAKNPAEGEALNRRSHRGVTKSC